MSDLFWPGDDRAGDLLSQGAFLDAMVEVESAWLAALVDHGVAPVSAADDLFDIARPSHLEWLANESELGGNPAIGLVELLRDGVTERNPEAARWLHRGLTSQDVVDTALMLCARDAVASLRAELRSQVEQLATLVSDHRSTAMVGRTLTQHAVPVTFGLKAAQWLTGVLDAWDDVAALRLQVQIGGAAGTLAAAVELAGPAGAQALVTSTAETLGLEVAAPWHTSRATLTRIGDAMVATTDACGRIAQDVLILSRPEIGELSEGQGGGSSTMPHKANPVLSVQVSRAALTTPALAATLHLASATQVDERADGAWHAEWATVRTLVRRSVVAAAQTGELLSGLRVHPARMRATLAAARDDVRAEQRAMAELTGRGPAGDYLGLAGELVDAALDRARTHLEETA